MRLKKFLLALVIISLCSCKYDEYEMPKDAFININPKTYEIYSKDAYLYDLFSDSNVEIISKNKKLDTKSIGERKVTLEYKYGKRKYKYDIKYNVVDTTKPVFLSANSYRTTYLGDDIYLCDDINFADNYDRNVSCSIQGDMDINTVGTYNLKYVIEDSSGNKNEKDFTLNVLSEPIKDNNSNSNNLVDTKKLLFSDVINNYKTQDNMIGIDVSYWQQNIDFEKVKNAGCEFVIIRIGVNSDIDKDLSVDSFFENNIKKAKEAGLKVGIYVYTSAINEKTAKEHAKWVVNTLNKEKLDFPIAFDWENWSKFRSYEISTYDLTTSFMAFKDEVKKSGYDAMLYSSMNYLNNDIWMFNDSYDVWLAHYTNQTSYQGDYIMWQMSNIGKIDGISSDVDIDIYYKK